MASILISFISASFRFHIPTRTILFCPFVISETGVEKSWNPPPNWLLAPCDRRAQSDFVGRCMLLARLHYKNATVGRNDHVKVSKKLLAALNKVNTFIDCQKKWLAILEGTWNTFFAHPTVPYRGNHAGMTESYTYGLVEQWWGWQDVSASSMAISEAAQRCGRLYIGKEEGKMSDHRWEGSVIVLLPSIPQQPARPMAHTSLSTHHL